MRYGTTITPDALSDEDRHHGLVALNLVGAWDSWIKRRVESLEFVNENTVLRRVSVDFRMRSWLPEPQLRWQSRGVHYIPIALLDKEPLLNFDLRDESGKALPLLTRRKNAAVAAAALSSLAQLTIWVNLVKAGGADSLRGNPGLPQDPRKILVPRSIEDDFFRITYLPYESSRSPGAKEVLRNFLGAPPSTLTDPGQWKWIASPAGFRADVGDALWRHQLLSDPKMLKLLEDFARVWMVSVPIEHQPDERRIVKFSYYEHRLEPELQPATRLKQVIRRFHLDRAHLRLEDKLEGLPPCDDAASDWDRQHSVQKTSDRITVWTKLAQSVAWQGHLIEFTTPAVGKGGSYHLEVRAPEGTQIRRATLAATRADELEDDHQLRGARGLQQAHLYVGDVSAGAQGNATVMLKPRSSTIVRSLALVAIASFVMLLGVRLKLPTLVDRSQGSAGALAPLFLVFPGLGAAAIARSTENAMTTSMLFGLRLIAVAVAALPLAGAGLLAAARRWPHIFCVWTLLAVLAGALALILIVSWRLAGRRRPDGSSP